MTIPELVSAAHARNLTLAEIATETGLALSTVKRCAKSLNLVGNGRRHVLTELAVAVVADHAAARDCAVVPAKAGAGYSLLINGVRVDVKAARYRSDHACVFYLASSKRPVAGRYSYNADHARSVDVVVFACCLNDAVQRLFMVDAAQVGKTMCFGPHHAHHVWEGRWDAFEARNADIPLP